MNQASFKEELNFLEAQGLRRTLRNHNEGGLLNFSSNDYLGLSQHPLVKKAVMEAVERYGTGGTSSRLLAGTFDLHRNLETSLASFLGKEAALVFGSGYHTNTGVLPVVASQGDIIFMDRLCHASMIDGIRLSQARFGTFDHNNVDHLESLLRKKRPSYRRAFIVTEGIFSMDGDKPILPEIVYLAERWNALVYVDEAHSIGMVGPDGRGMAAEMGLLSKIDILVGTLSKSLGSQGGFVAGQQSLIDLLVSRSRSFIYSTALSPANTAAAQTALKLLPSLESRRQNVLKAAQALREHVESHGFNTLESQFQIIPILTGDLLSTKNLSEYLFTHGFFVPSIRPPTVPVGQGRVRLSVTDELTKKPWTSLLDVFSRYPGRPRKGEEIVQAK